MRTIRRARRVAVVINESLGEAQVSGRDPIGQRLHVGPDSLAVGHDCGRGGRREADVAWRWDKKTRST